MYICTSTCKYAYAFIHASQNALNLKPLLPNRTRISLQTINSVPEDLNTPLARRFFTTDQHEFGGGARPVSMLHPAFPLFSLPLLFRPLPRQSL